jgi:hypothetical protein
MLIQKFVSAVPERMTQAEGVANCMCGTVDVVVDHKHTGGSWANYSEILRRARKSSAAWILSVDDDAWLCDDFDHNLDYVLDGCSCSDFVGLYLSSEPVTSRAKALGRSYVSTVRVVHGIGWAMRRYCVDEVLRVAEKLFKPGYYSGDQRLQAWLVATGRRNTIPIPNLIDHRHDMPSIIKGAENNAGSRSKSFVQDLSKEFWRGGVYQDNAPTNLHKVLKARGALRDSSRGLTI